MLSQQIPELLAQTAQTPTTPSEIPHEQTLNTFAMTSSLPFESAFLTAFLTASPFAAELLSLLDTVSKNRLFVSCSSLATYRNSCYAWQSVTLTKHGYAPQTSFAKQNYQIQARLLAPKRYLPLPDEFASSKVRSKAVVRPVESYFVKELDDTRVWDMFSVRPMFGTVLRDLVFDGTSVTMPLVVRLLTVCKVNGKGLRSLSLRYCEKVRFEEVMDVLPKKVLEVENGDDDSGFESQGESEDGREVDDSLLTSLQDLSLHGIKNLNILTQDHKRWLSDIDRFFKYTTDNNIQTDIGWCSQTLTGNKKRLRRPMCHSGRDLPFIRILPLADTGSTRNTRCLKCNKGPEEIGWHCDGCLKDVLCECCGTFLCDQCDPQRKRLMKCEDCPARRCGDCFTRNGGMKCRKAECDGHTTCGEHKLEIECKACKESHVVSCLACNPARKCQRCPNWIYDHCGEKTSFSCECDFELCEGCCDAAKERFSEQNLVDGSLEEIVYAIDSAEYPIVPKKFKGADESWLKDNENWCCFYCRIMPRRKERFAGPKGMKAASSRMRR